MTADLSRVAKRLDEDIVGWLTTVTPGGQPQSSIVWFLRDGNDLLIYSRPGKPKLGNITSNPQVAFHLHSDPRGHSMITMEGNAVILEDPEPAYQNPAYVKKYAAVIADSGWTNESFSTDYPVLIRVTIGRLRHPF